MDVTVVIPAHNEEAYLPACLAAVRTAAAHLDSPVEVVVVANRCTDRTAELAMAGGATVVQHGGRCIAAVRNSGVAVSTGDVVVTVDADCVMHPDTLRQVVEHLATGRFVGGGTKVVPERRSPGISATYAVMEVPVAAVGARHRHQVRRQVLPRLQRLTGPSPPGSTPSERTPGTQNLSATGRFFRFDEWFLALPSDPPQVRAHKSPMRGHGATHDPPDH